MIPEDTLLVFRRAARGFVADRRYREVRARPAHGGTGRDFDADLAEFNRRALVEAERNYREVYGASSIETAIRRYGKDKAFCQALLESTAADLGAQALTRMEKVHREIWNRYLHEREGNSENLRGFARALSAWLVYKAGAPFAMIEEDESFWSVSRLGRPPEPGQVPMRRPSLPGGVRDGGQSDEMTVDEALDAGVAVPENPGPGQPLGPDLPGRFRAWGRPDADHALYPLALFDMPTAEMLMFRLLMPEVEGHPLLLMLEQRLGDTHPMSPADMYLSLRRSASERDRDIKAMIRKVEQFLYGGLETYRENLTGRDWEELRPLLVASKHLLFPESSPTSVEHQFCDYLIEEVIGWTPRQILQVVALGVSIGLGILLAAPTLGGSLGLSALAITTAMVVFDTASVAVSIGIAIDQHRERTRSNRFAAIDEGLRVASSSDNLHWDVVIDILMLVVPPAAGSAARAARNAWLRRALKALPPEIVEEVATPAARRAAQRALAQAEGTGDTATGLARRLTADMDDVPTPRLRQGEALAEGGGPTRAPNDPAAGAAEEASTTRHSGEDPRGTTSPLAQADPFASLTSRQRREISRLRTALTGSTRDRIPEEVVRDYLRFFMGRGYNLDEAIELTRRWANIQASLQRLGTASLPNPSDLDPMRRFLSQPGVSVEEAMSGAERSIALRMSEPMPNPSGVDRARSSEVSGPRRPRVPTPRQRNAEGLVGYGSTDLSEAVLIRRAGPPPDSGLRNYAAVEFADHEGDLRIFVLPSQRGVAHSEPRLVETLRRAGIEPNRITRLYTERSPCVQQAHCSAYLQSVLPEDARVTWSFDFETDADVTNAIQAALRRQANRDLARQVRPGSVTNPRTDVFEIDGIGANGH